MNAETFQILTLAFSGIASICGFLIANSYLTMAKDLKQLTESFASFKVAQESRLTRIETLQGISQ